MKRVTIYAVLIAVSIAINLLTGCSGAGKNKPTDISGLDNIVNKGSAGNQDQITLTFYFKNSYAKTNTQAVMDEIQKRLKDKLNIKLNFKFITYLEKGTDVTYGYNKMIQARIASGETFEAFFYTDHQLPYNMADNDTYLNLDTLVNKGMAKDLSQLFPKYAPNLYGKYSKEELKAVTFNGRLAAVPSLFQSSKRCCAIVRKDLMDKYSIPAINNIDDFEGYLKVIREKEPDLVPLSLRFSLKDIVVEKAGYVSLDNYTGLVYKWNDPEMKLIYYKELPEYGIYSKMAKDWRAKGYFLNAAGQEPEFSYNGPWTLQPDSPMPASFLGCSAIDNFILSGDHYEPILWNTEKEIAVYPLFPDKAAQLISPSNEAIVIPSTAKYPEKTLQFLEWVQSSQENYDLLMYGILGKDYTLYGKQYVPQGDYVKYGMSDYIGWPCSRPFWNIEYLRTSINSSPNDKDEYKRLLESDSKYPPHAGFCPDYTLLVKNEFEKFLYNTEVTDEEKSRLKSEMQRQLDEWRKNNAR